MLKTLFLLVIATSIIALCRAEEALYNINGKKILHKVSDKFLSISIDPAVLLAGANLSDTSLTLAKHLSPAYIRLAGPSTPFVQYLDNEEEVFLRKELGSNVYITPSMWFGINEWFNLASLTPVFGINEGDTSKGVWNPQSTIPLLEMSDKFGVTCYWQLGYGCSNKSTVQYVEDLNILRQTLKGFPEHNDTWRIVGSDLSSCISDDGSENYIRDLDEYVDAIMWQYPLISKGDLGLTKAALWASIPKDTQPVTFSSAIDWAIKVGQAATLEYDVIFREPRLVEFTNDTPVYWFSFLYKKLMGTNVLDIKAIAKQNWNLITFAHCTRRQSDFVRSGAVTVLMVNNGTEMGLANIRLGNLLLDKSMEVQSYLLEASKESSSKVLLNDQLLTMDKLRSPDDILKPKLRRAKMLTHISLEIPPQTIAFFVLTGAKYALCSKNEDELSNILAEINQEQDNEPLRSEESLFNIEGRNHQELGGKFPVGYKTTLEDIKRNILEEMEQDKLYYDKKLFAFANKNTLTKQDKKEMLHDHLKSFINKSRKHDLKPATESAPNMHLTIREVEELLKQRARAKAAARNIKLTSSELDMLVDKATLKIPKHFVLKRDINQILLEEKANFYKNNIFNQEMYEQRAKENKFKFPRSINTPLLNLKAIMEENQKYLLSRGEHLQAPPRNVRDINFDMLGKRSEPFGRGKSMNAFKNDGKYDALSLDGQTNEELFDDLLQFEEKMFEDFTSPRRHAFADLDSLDLDKIDQGFFNKKPKTKSFWQPRPVKKLLKTKNEPSEEYLQFLKSSSGNLVSDEEPCVDKFEFASFSPKNNEKSWTMKNKAQKPQSPCFFLDDINFSDDLDYGFFRKKRDSSTTVTKKKLKDMKKEVQKLKNQLKDDKRKYLKNKIEKKKNELIKRRRTNNIQTIPKSHATIKQLILNANSNENTIQPPLQRHNIQKRSLFNNDINQIFGKYKPLTPSLKAWKPSDILNLHRNNFLNWPLYSWVQDQNLRELRMNYLKQFGLRKRRYIDTDNGQNHNVLDSRKRLQKIIVDGTSTTERIGKEVTATMTAKESQSYLETILGEKKIQAFEDFYRNTKNGLDAVNKSVKDFLYNLF